MHRKARLSRTRTRGGALVSSIAIIIVGSAVPAIAHPAPAVVDEVSAGTPRLGDLPSVNAVDAGAASAVFEWGQVPYGRGEVVTAPRRVGDFIDVTRVVSGVNASYVLREDGTLWAWGQESNGLLGNAVTQCCRSTGEPVEVAASLYPIVDVAAAQYTTAALDSQGRVMVWGSNTVGLLGEFATGIFSTGTPLPLDGSGWTPGTGAAVEDVVDVAAGVSNFYALRADGTVIAWGYNGDGQLGDGSEVDASAVPVQVAGLTDVVQIAGADDAAFAVKSDGTVWMWGSDGTTVHRTPVQVDGLSDVVLIPDAFTSYFALTGSGRVWAWGDNDEGQLGLGYAGDRVLEPTLIPGLSGVVDVAAGWWNGLAIKRDGSVWGWGGDWNGLLGSYTSGNVPFPVRVRGIADATAISASRNHALAIGGEFVAADTYVALGDSFQSGEGAFSYEAGTDTDRNRCHRAESAYPWLLTQGLAAALELDFRACSGAVIEDVVGGQWNEGPQIDALGESTRLVTIGIGGNDLGFSSMLELCISSNAITLPLPHIRSSCVTSTEDLAQWALDEVSGGDIRSDMVELYRYIRAQAPNARIVVVTYPQFFDGGSNAPECLLRSGMSAGDQRWINSLVRAVDEYIEINALVAGLEVVDIRDAFDGHGLCGGTPAINGLIPDAHNVAAPESFHPNELGHELIADALTAAIDRPVVPTLVLSPQETVRQTFQVSGRTLSVNIAWPGSDVIASLVSPSGVMYTREEPGEAVHGNGPTYEYYEVAQPEAGEWTVVLYGADVDPEGEPVTLSVFDEPVPNSAPEAVVDVAGTGRTFAFDASGSSDADGQLVRYEWFFSDGSVAEGVTVEHTFTQPGEHTAQLIVTDDDGAEGFATSSAVVVPDESVVLYSGDDLLIGPGLSVGAPDGETRVDGSIVCLAGGRVHGDLAASGTVRLGRGCTVDGDVAAGTAVILEGGAAVGGSVSAVQSVRIVPSASVGGEVRAGSVTASDGRDPLSLAGTETVGGQVLVGVDVPAPDVARPEVPSAPSAAVTVPWSAWRSGDGQRSSRHRGLSCVGGGVGWATDAYTVTEPTVVDARHDTSGCGVVVLRNATVRLSADVTLLADSLLVEGVVRVVSADGEPHTMSVVARDGGDVHVVGAFRTDGTADVELWADRQVVVLGVADGFSRVVGGAVRVLGRVTIGDR